MTTSERPHEAADRALQQLIATAIKHSSSEVSFDLNGETTRIVFRFEEENPSSVEMKVSPEEVAGAILRRSFVEWDEGTPIRAVLRIEFKSLTADAEVLFRFPREIGSRAAIGAVAAATRRSVSFRSFLIDGNENPLFWLGLGATSRDVRTMVGREQGVLLVASELNASRNLALRSVRSLFSGSEVIALANELNPEDGFLERAQTRSVVVGVEGSDVFSSVERVLALPAQSRKMFAGILACAHLPRNCIACNDEYIPLREASQKLVERRAAPLARPMRGRGCPVCSQTGVVGTVQIHSFLPFTGELRHLLVEGAGPETTLPLLSALPSFQSMFEKALECASRGEVTLENVLASCAMPPALYDLHAAATKRSIQPPVDDSPLAINDNFFFASDDGAKGRTEPANPSSAEEVVIPSEPLIENAIPAEETTLMVERATGPRILLIEDDPDQRAVISRVLELSGYSVDCAGSGIEGLVSANRKTPSLIVVDFMMPGVDGRETIRRLRQNDRTAETPILALTATPDPEIEYAMLNAGANDFCPKSVSKRVLLKRIERLLKNEAGD